MIGLGVYDVLARDILDPDTGEIYPALSCMNDKVMAERCSVPGAQKAIWSVKASASFNSDAAYLLREGFKSGRIRLPINEYDAEDALSEIKGYKSLSPAEKIKFQLPYINTTLLVDELTKLEYEEAGGKVKIHERSNMRKDRYSSLAYNYYVATKLESKLDRKRQLNESDAKLFIIKPPKAAGKAVRANSGKSKNWRG